MYMKLISSVVVGLATIIPVYQFFSTENYTVFETFNHPYELCGKFEGSGVSTYVKNSFQTPEFAKELEKLDGERIYLSNFTIFYGELYSANEEPLDSDLYCASTYSFAKCDGSEDYCALMISIPHHSIPVEFDSPSHVLSIPLNDTAGFLVKETDDPQISFEGLVDVNVQATHGFTILNLTSVDPGQNDSVQKRYECSRDIAKFGYWRGKAKCVFGI